MPPPLASRSLELADPRGAAVCGVEGLRRSDLRREPCKSLDGIHLIREAAHVRPPSAQGRRRKGVREDPLRALRRKKSAARGVDDGLGVTQVSRGQRGGQHPRDVDSGERCRFSQPLSHPLEEDRVEELCDLGRGPRGEGHGARVPVSASLSGQCGRELRCRQPSQHRPLLGLRNLRQAEGRDRGIAQVAPLTDNARSLRARHTAQRLHERVLLGQAHLSEPLHGQVAQSANLGITHRRDSCCRWTLCSHSRIHDCSFCIPLVPEGTPGARLGTHPGLVRRHLPEIVLPKMTGRPTPDAVDAVLAGRLACQEKG